jgi:hypothetical protein
MDTVRGWRQALEPRAGAVREQMRSSALPRSSRIAGPRATDRSRVAVVNRLPSFRRVGSSTAGEGVTPVPDPRGCSIAVVPAAWRLNG